jgi:hypothetical protein
MTFTIGNKEFQPKGEITLDRSLQTEEAWPGVTAAQSEIVGALEECIQMLVAVVGRPQDLVSVRASGHANPNHAPPAGWGDEFVSIAIHVKPVDRA